jgi:hypothetical protein
VVRDPVSDVPSVHTQLVHRPAARAASATLPYSGGSVLHWNRTFAVFWQPSGLQFDPGYTQLVTAFLTGVAHDSHLPGNVYSLTGQYTDAGGAAQYGSAFGGAILDTDPLPARDPACQEPPAPPLDTGPGWVQCVTDTQIQSELTHVAAVHHIAATLGNVLLLLTPNGLGVCDTGTLPPACALGGSGHNGFCGYHSATTATLLYAVIPYNAVSGHCESDAPRPNGSSADPALSTLSHEHNELITDPLDDGWVDSAGNEDGDLCLDQASHPPVALGGTGAGRYDQRINGGRYWLQLEWSNAEGGCAARDESDPLRLSLPRSGLAGRSLTLGIRGSDPDGRITGYTWSFGDGHRGWGASPRHAYRRPGRYALLARSTDSAGNWSFAAGTIRIQRPPRSGRHRHARPA